MTNVTLGARRSDLRDSIEEHGFVVIPNAISKAKIARLVAALEQTMNGEAILEREGQPFGMRNLLELVPAARALAESEPLMSIARDIMGNKARVVRGLLFDKNLKANWKVAWHQDLTIAVRENLPVAGFDRWTVKANVFHVQPPANILKSMIALRVHLDDSDESNGALSVIPGSHRHGRLSPEEIDKLKSSGRTLCEVPRGGILAMRPLLLHSSLSGSKPEHRRVLHFEYSGVDLPKPLQWHYA